MKRAVLLLVFLAVFSGVLYGLGLPPFRKQIINEPPRQGQSGRAVAVEVGKVTVGVIEENISARGSLLAQSYVSVAPKISGRVERIQVNVGDPVKSGQVIAQMDQRQFTEELREAEAALRVAEATLKGKRAELADLRKKLQRAQQLFQKKFISRQELDTLDSDVATGAAEVELTSAQVAQMNARLANALLQLNEAQIVAPFAGYVEKRLVDPGALVNSGTPIATIVQISPVKVLVPVVEKDYPKVSAGQDARVSVDAFPGEVFHGKVVRKTPVLSQETRTGEVEIEVKNPVGRLKPGMFAKVELSLNQRRNVMLIPEGALVKAAASYGVFRVRSSKGKASIAELVPVQSGARHEGNIEVQGKLEAGDSVVTLGSNLLKDGQRVRIAGAASRQSAQGNSP